MWWNYGGKYSIQELLRSKRNKKGKKKKNWQKTTFWD